jgi:hypothetical protein
MKKIDWNDPQRRWDWIADKRKEALSKGLCRCGKKRDDSKKKMCRDCREKTRTAKQATRKAMRLSRAFTDEE